MRLPILLALLVAMSATSAASAGDTECNMEIAKIAEPGIEAQRIVEDAARRWIACQRGMVSVPTIRLEATYEKTTNNAPLPYYIHRYDGPRTITIGLSGAISPDMSPAEIQDRIEFVAPDGLPTPGLSAPDWRIIAETPSSHITEGITVAEVSEGRLVINIKTRVFAIYGRDMRIVVPADAPTPKHGFFALREDMSFDVTFDLALTGF
jgi:hypothetical protein